MNWYSREYPNRFAIQYTNSQGRFYVWRRPEKNWQLATMGTFASPTSVTLFKRSEMRFLSQTGHSQFIVFANTRNKLALNQLKIGKTGAMLMETAPPVNIEDENSWPPLWQHRLTLIVGLHEPDDIPCTEFVATDFLGDRQALMRFHPASHSLSIPSTLAIRTESYENTEQQILGHRVPSSRQTTSNSEAVYRRETRNDDATDQLTPLSLRFHQHNGRLIHCIDQTCQICQSE